MTVSENQSNTLPFNDWLRKMHFLCKRGNLESELLLIAYLDKLDDAITVEQQENLESLLQENDQNLMCWLMKFDPKHPNDSVVIPDEYLSLIDDIRTSYLK